MKFLDYLAEHLPAVALLVDTIVGLATLIEWLRKNRLIFGRHTITIFVGLTSLCIGLWVGQYYKVVSVEQHLRQTINSVSAENEKFELEIAGLKSEIAKLKGEPNQMPVNEVILYEYPNFKGTSRRVYLGEDQRNLHDYGFGDKASSIELKGDVEAVAYEDTDFRGKYFPIRESDPKLPPEWNNKVSSIKVKKK